VRLFKDLGDSVSANPAFTSVFDGQLPLDDERLAVGDVASPASSTSWGTEEPERQRGEPGWDARAIDVTVGRSST
jgi:hypothetical protein